MERLTIREDDFVYISMRDRTHAIERLADIEDILGDTYDLSLLRELVEASNQVGKYVIWDHGTHKSVQAILTVMLCPEGIRYDLGLIQPLTNHPSILKILSLEEAESALTPVEQAKEA